MQVKVCPISFCAVPSMSRAPTLASVPLMFTSADQSMIVPPRVSSRSFISPIGVHRAARCLAVRGDLGALQRDPLDERHVHVERRGDESDADLGTRVEVVFVDGLDLLDARPAAADPVRIHEEIPDRRARRSDLFGATELHSVLRGRSGSGADRAASQVSWRSWAGSDDTED